MGMSNALDIYSSHELNMGSSTLTIQGLDEWSGVSFWSVMFYHSRVISEVIPGPMCKVLCDAREWSDLYASTEISRVERFGYPILKKKMKACPQLSFMSTLALTGYEHRPQKEKLINEIRNRGCRLIWVWARDGRKTKTAINVSLPCCP